MLRRENNQSNVRDSNIIYNVRDEPFRVAHFTILL